MADFMVGKNHGFGAKGVPNESCGLSCNAYNAAIACFTVDLAVVFGGYHTS